MVFINGHIAHALFNTSAIHSFISKQFVKLVGLETRSLEIFLNVY